MALPAGATTHVNPTPTAPVILPTNSPPSANFLPVPTPTITPTVAPRPETFAIQLNSLGTNFARATGPVNGTGSDVQVNTFLDRLRLPNAANRVNLFHPSLPAPSINLSTCTATYNQTAPWAFAGGTGVNLHATGSGTYRLAALFAFPKRAGVCSITPFGINPLRSVFWSVAVYGTGTASR